MSKITEVNVIETAETLTDEELDVVAGGENCGLDNLAEYFVVGFLKGGGTFRPPGGWK
jgi:hypothetical protein